ncbi:LysR family transcriptional regulator [Desulfuribacillus alkaliarsenatis]|uniref:LysR family transcriptional regulator n=1 Tax=Desulfuribacillus alkaliarsenatis TaxID=766136 RepID=A0A1E5G1C8_9FIRM|nr:LysR family transcriptional regulator [Desulfuribacillus alkaliarsenatis]OEF96714.1 LysR family transcriptional regulator [Desulfuribacillus alkaliarsenatis]
MDISFELYKVFYHVASSLSFSEASSRLYVSQSAISQSIKLLEDKLGCKLFYRSTKSVSLTREGGVLFQHIEQAYYAIKNGERKLSELASLQSGEVRVGASDTICKHYLLPYFREFNRKYPQIKIHVTNRPSPTCLELLSKGAVDVVIIHLPEKLKHDSVRILESKLIQDVFVAGNGFSKLKNKALALQELADLPLLALEKNTTTRDFLDQYLLTHKISLEPEIELSSLDLLIDLVKINFGISFITKDYIQQELASGELFALNVQEYIPSRQLAIVANKHIELPKAALEFVNLLKPSFQND